MTERWKRLIRFLRAVAPSWPLPPQRVLSAFGEDKFDLGQCVT